ncbi:unnamed protein product, partial [marine sediment metagenome]
ANNLRDHIAHYPGEKCLLATAKAQAAMTEESILENLHQVIINGCLREEVEAILGWSGLQPKVA